MKIVFLYTEIADYFISACLELAKDAQVHIVRWEVAKEAPFQFDFSDKLNIYSRDNYDNPSLQSLINRINPDIIFCSGWIDKGYIKIIKQYSGKVPTVLTMDNHYNGKLKQLGAILFSKYSFLKYFSNAWVPGIPQFKYVKKLGFKEDTVQTGFYCANTTSFNTFYDTSFNEKRKNYPKRFFYLGRYVKHKGIFDLWEAYKSYRRNGGNWELLCVGAGDEWENRMQVDGIIHLGFKQPNEIPEILKSCGVYILPSHFEPWGVSVHEMAAAGLPLILSEKIGAASQFLDIDKNGFQFSSGNIDELEKKLTKVSNLKSSELIEMGNRSHELAQSLTPKQWATKALNFLNL